MYAIRSAKAGRLASFQVTHPDTTLTSSNSNNHIRRALQALPHDPADSPTVPSSPSSKRKKSEQKFVRRGKVDHFVPAIWVPDQKTETCMRCNSRFGWRRRRHHCRLCGRVVCANCSDKVCSHEMLSIMIVTYLIMVSFFRHSISLIRTMQLAYRHQQEHATHVMRRYSPSFLIH